MKTAFVYNLKPRSPASGTDLPEDFYEEYDPPETVTAIAATLRGFGLDVTELEADERFLPRLLELQPDFVFNLAEGRGAFRSREAHVPAVLEMLGIPYFGSDPMTLAVTLDKGAGKLLARGAGIPTAPFWMAGTEKELAAVEKEILAHLPVFAKPAFEGSSKGIRLKSRLSTPEEYRSFAADLLRTYHQPVIFETFLGGAEYTVGVVGNDPPRVCGMMEIAPNGKFNREQPHFIYSLEVKRNYKELVEYRGPDRIPAPVRAELERLALASYRALGCRDVSRIDFRADDQGKIYFLEINPLPGMSPVYSDIVIAANLSGGNYRDLFREMLNAALTRNGFPAIG